jgi:hypothetical protein
MINLLPPSLKSEYQASRKNSLLRLYIIIAVIVIVAVVAIFGYSLSSLNRAQSDASADVNSNKQAVKDLEASSVQAQNLARKVTTIGKLIDQKIYLSSMVVDIGKSTPPGAALTGLQLNVADLSNKPVTLVFGVDSKNTAAILRNNLAQNTDLFSSVDITSLATQTPGSSSSSSASSTTSSSPSSTATIYPYVVTLNVELKTLGDQ